ncbi:MAG: GtrA family protein [bacterium]|nr:GtrA family protein [bacterium]
MKLSNLLKIFLSGEFIRFAVVGGIGFCVDFGSYLVMTRILGLRSVFCYGLGEQQSYWTALTQNASETCSVSHFPIILATMISVLLAILSNFLFNKFWTFRKTAGTGDVAKQGLSYFGLNFVTYIMNQLLVGFFVSDFGLLRVFPNYVDVSAKVLAVGIVLFFNFFGSKFLVFRRGE